MKSSSPRDCPDRPTFSNYQKLPPTKGTYLAHVVAVRDPLNFHLDIYWPCEIGQRYSSAIHYDYTFISEELAEQVYTRPAYSCHLRGVEILTNDEDGFRNMKEAYILISKRILRSGGWVLVSVSDVDIYRRVLVNIFDVVTKRSINQELLSYTSPRSGEPIAKEYIRPSKNKPMFSPKRDIPKHYHIVYETP